MKDRACLRMVGDLLAVLRAMPPDILWGPPLPLWTSITLAINGQ